MPIKVHHGLDHEIHTELSKDKSNRLSPSPSASQLTTIYETTESNGIKKLTKNYSDHRLSTSFSENYFHVHPRLSVALSEKAFEDNFSITMPASDHILSSSENYIIKYYKPSPDCINLIHLII